MQVEILDKKLREAVLDDSLLQRRYGEMAPKIRLRIGALQAAESLEDFWPPKTGPERCHELSGDLSGIFSMDLRHPYRLLFQPSEEAVRSGSPTTGKDRWAEIKSIRILRIEDTHG